MGIFFGKKKRKKNTKRAVAPAKRGAGPKIKPEPEQVSGGPPKPTPVRPKAHKSEYRNNLYAQPKAKSKRRKNIGSERKTFLGRSRRQWLLLFLSLSFTGLIALAIGAVYVAQTLPDISTLGVIKKQRGVTFETEDGTILASYGDVYGNALTYNQIPKSLIQAVVATEDRRFFSHGGVDLQGILRAAVVNAWAGHLVQGGSTITQQLAKNVFLTPKRSLLRKAQEAMLALWLESKYSKQQILAIYLNRVYLGAGTFGVDAASKRYFGKPATQLSLMESAILAGLLKAPSRYAPTSSIERAKKRAHQVLLNMVDAGVLKPEAVQPALNSFHSTQAMQAAQGSDVRYFTDWVMDQLPEYIGRIEEDVIVTTTLNPQLQHQAQDALQQAIARDGDVGKVHQGAVVALSPDGAVRALLGGINYQNSSFNRATQARRQPGSVFKLFVYLAALEAGMTPQSQVTDGPITLRVGNSNWSPDNYTKKYKGEISMSQALRESLNTVSVRLSQYAGIGQVAKMAGRLGIENVPARPSIALGAVETNLLRLTTAYAHLASSGYKIEPFGILRIRTQKGQQIYKREYPQQNQLLSNDVVEMMNYMLLDTVRRGTAVKAALPGRDAAGKTGTSQNFKDAWFIGFTKQLVTGVWVGNDNNTPMNHVTGGSIPAQIWHDFMLQAMSGLPDERIPNSAGSSGGLLPWLFGDSTNNTGQALPNNNPQPIGEINNVPVSPENNGLPSDLPFKLQGAE